VKLKQPDRQIAVLGVGQLGSRYVQALLSGIEPLNIWLQDPAINSRSEFDSWRSNYGVDMGHHSVNFSMNPQESPAHFDLVISATTADVRYQSLDAFLDRKTFDYLILEKLLTTRIVDLKSISVLVQRARGCWVNYPRRLWPFYQHLKRALQATGPLQVIVEGTDWNLASNSSHFCDLTRWLTGEELVSLDCSVIDEDWKESKRPNFVAFTGTLKYEYAQGSELILKSRRMAPDEHVSPFKISIRDSVGDATINEAAGTAQGSLLRENLQGEILYQSELTSDLVCEILETGRCGLPTFHDVRNDHAMYLNELLAYQRRVHLNFSQTVRIT
jgi:predicted dehydrogenase